MKLIYVGLNKKRNLSEYLRKKCNIVTAVMWSVLVVMIVCTAIFHEGRNGTMSAVVLLEVPDGTGSAVYVQDVNGTDLLLTACHVVADLQIGDEVIAIFQDPNNMDYSLETTAILLTKGWKGQDGAIENDYALLQLNNAHICDIAVPCPLGNSENEKVNNMVSVEGFPNGVYSVTTGIISNVNGGVTNNKNMFVVSAKAWPGNSGGALLDSKQALIGIATNVGVHFNVQDQTMCVKLDYIKQELRKHGFKL